MIGKLLLSKLLILSFVCSVFGASIDDDRVVIDVKSLTLYNSWKTQNMRIFINEDEKIYRQLIFFENLKKINQNNEDPTSTFKMAPDQFSDMTDEEFAEKILNQEMQSSQNKRLLQKNDNRLLLDNDDHGEPDPHPEDLYPLLESINWRDRGYVTGVKNQGGCGSCWAFSAVALMESYNLMSTRITKLFSEQQLVDCVNSSLGYSSKGCGGGWPHHALGYAKRFGILQQHEYPYTGVAGRCRVTAPTTGYYPKSYRKLGNTVYALKSLLNNHPVSVALDASKWKGYSGGIFNKCSSSVKLNHAVLAVGYDRAENWIIKNSWGTRWGDNGYMTLKRGNSCGIVESSYDLA